MTHWDPSSPAPPPPPVASPPVYGGPPSYSSPPAVGAPPTGPDSYVPTVPPAQVVPSGFGPPTPPVASPYPYPGAWEPAAYPPARRSIPGNTVAGIIIGFVHAVFLIVSGIVIALGAGFVKLMSDADTDVGSDNGGAILLLALALANWLAAVLFVVGGALLIGRRRVGLFLMTAAVVILCGLAVYWSVSIADSFVTIWACVITAVALLALVLALVGRTMRWLAEPRDSGPSLPPAPFAQPRHGGPFGS